MPDRLADFRFYAERRDGPPTVCAVHRSRTTTTGYRKALVTVTEHPEGGLTWSAVSRASRRPALANLRSRCRLVSLATATTLHPALVRRLVHDLHTA